MNSTAQQVYYTNVAGNMQWVRSSYPLNPIPKPYPFYPTSSTTMIAPQPQGHYYYTPNGQCCSSYIQKVQQYQYSVARAPAGVYYEARPAYGSVYAGPFYTYNQPLMANLMMNPVQQHQTPLGQLPAVTSLPKRARKQIVIRDPNQGGRDITKEIMSGLDTKTKSVQEIQSAVMISPAPASPAIPAQLPVSGSVEVDSIEKLDLKTISLEPICIELKGKEQDVIKVSDALQTSSPYAPQEIPELSVMNGSLNVPVESGKEVEPLVPVIDVGTVSDPTPNEVPSEEASFATGKASDVKSTPTSDPERLIKNIDTEERLKEVIGVVYEKATSEPNSSVIYADLCLRLKEVKLGSTTNFQKLLLSRCQEELKKRKKLDSLRGRKQKELDAAIQGTDLEDEKIRTLRRPLCNMEFIAELFKRKLLPRLFVNSWIEELLLVNPTEGNLESLCKLLAVAGKELQGEGDKSRLDLYFNMIKRIIKQRKTSSRLCDMLRDIVDLKQNNWVPGTINQDTKSDMKVHKEAEQEKQKEKICSQQHLLSNKDSNPGRVGPEMTKQDDGLITVTIKNRTVNTFCPSNINKSQAGTLKDNQFSASGIKCSWENWGKGSGRGSRENNSAGLRTKYFNEHCDRDLHRFERWDRRDRWDRRYTAQPVRPRPEIQKHHREQSSKAARASQNKARQNSCLQNERPSKTKHYQYNSTIKILLLFDCVDCLLLHICPTE